MAKDTYYFSHDFSARNDPKLQELQMVHGMAGIGMFWCLVEMLHEQDGYLMLSQCKSYAFALRVDCDLIKSLVSDFGLFENDGERFWSISALERIQERKSKSKKATESANARWKNANAMRTQCDGNAIKESKGNERKENERESRADAPEILEKKEPPAKKKNREQPPHSGAPPPEITMPWGTESFLSAWEEWKIYKKQQHRFTYKSIRTEQAALVDLCELSAGQESTALLIIRQSIAKGWSGLFELKPPTNGNGKPRSESAYQNQRNELADYYASLAGKG